MKFKRLNNHTVKLDGKAYISMGYLFNWITERLSCAPTIEKEEWHLIKELNMELGDSAWDENPEDEGKEMEIEKVS